MVPMTRKPRFLRSPLLPPLVVGLWGWVLLWSTLSRRLDLLLNASLSPRCWHCRGGVAGAGRPAVALGHQATRRDGTQGMVVLGSDGRRDSGGASCPVL